MKTHKILIVGGGFTGIRTALDLSKKKLKNTEITLISDKHHFEFTPALYKLAVGRSPRESCIPLYEIFHKKNVKVIVDSITGADLGRHIVFSESGAQYKYDTVLFALGSELADFGIPGIKDDTFNIKTVENALELKHQFHHLFDTHDGLTRGELIKHFQFIVVGGGPAGIELAGEIRKYIRHLADNHEVPQNLVTVNIIQGGERLLPRMPEKVSKKVLKRLSDLGINTVLGRHVQKRDNHGVDLSDIQFNAKTIIWTAGVKPNTLYKEIQGLELDKNGRVFVDDALRARGYSNVFIGGDGANTEFAGTAQTAIGDGHFIAQTISKHIQDKKLPKYRAKQTPYVVPAGPGWAVLTYKGFVISGRIIWWLRQLIDLHFFLTILPLKKALSIWKEGDVLCESCPTCGELKH